MNDFLPTKKEEKTALVEVESQRAIQETQAAMIIAKKFPRDQFESYTKIMEACKRKSLAEGALYAYPRGGKLVTGPSIRLAEAIAQAWGNLQFGIRELEQNNGASTVEAFAWDIESNTRQVKIFQVKHERYTKRGSYALSDPRDVYEIVANQGARRLRACILGVIPGDVIEAAVAQCEKTLTDGNGEMSTKDRIKAMIVKFGEIGVTQKMIEDRIGHKVDVCIPQEIVNLGKIYKSIADGMAAREDFFEVAASAVKAKDGEKLADKLKNENPGDGIPE